MDDKASKKAKAVTNSTPVKDKTNLIIESPLNVRHGPEKYWQKEIENAEAMISDSEITPLTKDEILPELILVKKTAPKQICKATCITQVHGSMEAKHIVAKVSFLEHEKEKKTNILKQNKKLKDLLDANKNAHVKKNHVKHLD